MIVSAISNTKIGVRFHVPYGNNSLASLNAIDAQPIGITGLSSEVESRSSWFPIKYWKNVVFPKKYMVPKSDCGMITKNTVATATYGNFSKTKNFNPQRFTVTLSDNEVHNTYQTPLLTHPRRQIPLTHLP